MGFILDGLDTEEYDRQYSDGDLLKRIVGYFRPYARPMLLVSVMITLNSVASTAAPILVSRGVDVLAEDPTTQGILLMAGGILLLGVSAWVFNFIRQYFSARVTGNVVLNLRRDVFAATVRHDLSFYDAHPSGKVVSRVTSDTQDFAAVVDLTLNLLSMVLLVLLLTMWLFTINSWLTLLMIGMTPFAVGIALSFRRVARKVTQDARRITAVLNAQIQESISGIIVAKGFRQEAAIYATFDEGNKDGYKFGLRRGTIMMAIFPVMGLASGISTAILIYLGGLATRDGGSLTPGNWYLFMQAVGFYWWPMMNIASFWSQFQDGLSASERVFALIDREPKVTQVGNEAVGRVNGRLTFNHVQFRYTDKEVVLPDFSLDIQAGETVALVGHTGAGKSSIAKLVTRYYEFQGGELLVDGRDIRRLDLSQFRRQIGIVPQEPFLFTGTVRDNIRYGHPEATDEQVFQAALHIGNGDWLDALPQGLDTDVGERGSHLSMGQRQLVALARVLLKNPAIFVLDEATASIDPFTETQIQEGLEALMQERTAIVIAHRLSTIKSADRIIVMQNGRIIEEGTHNSLMSQGGHYAELYNTYFRHQSLQYINVDFLQLE
ncbi:MAG: ABC transporter ATP-binding protein [Ardenticatenaceae bacterium]|nr:ABC transporter ATP-binding protein [Ardenticatenaceae bacterium]